MAKAILRMFAGVRVRVTVAAVLAVAVAAAVAAPAVPVTLSWQTTAMPIAGTSSSRHFRPRAGGDPRPDLADDSRPDQGMRMCDPSRSARARQSQYLPRPAVTPNVTVPRYETLSDGI